MSENAQALLGFLAYLVVGVLVLVTVRRDEQSLIDITGAKFGSRGQAFAAIFWPVSLFLHLITFTLDLIQGARPRLSVILPRLNREQGLDKVARPGAFYLVPTLAGALTGTAAVVIMLRWPTLATYSIGLFLPAGAILLGVLAASGYALAGTSARRPGGRPFVWLGAVLAIGSYAAFHLVSFRQVADSSVTLLGYYTDYLVNMRIGFHGRTASESLTTEPLGTLGILREILVIAGLAGGGAFSALFADRSDRATI